MDLFGAHVVVIGPYCEEACCHLQGLGAHVYHLGSRDEAIKGLFSLFSKKVEPDAVILNWQINDPESKENRFYRLANRETFNTAGSVLDTLIKLLSGTPILVHNVSGATIPDCITSIPGVEILSEDKNPVEELLREPSIEGRGA